MVLAQKVFYFKSIRIIQIGKKKSIWNDKGVGIERYMKIEYNEKEIAAMAEFHKGNRAEGLRLQEEIRIKNDMYRISKRICRQRPLPMSKSL